MKRKLLFAIVALLCSVATWAETDVTASYIGDVTWIVNGGGHNHSSSNHKESDGIGWWNTQTLANGWHAFVAPNAEGGVGESWTSGFGSAGVMMGRTMVLLEGNYTLSFDAFACNATNSSDPDTMPTAGDAVAFLTGKDNVDITNTASAGDATFHNVSFTFDVTTANTVYEFGIKKLTDGSKIDWCQIKNVTLTLNSTNIFPVANNSIASFNYNGSQTWHTNTWSVEGQSDGTRFQVPFHELWVGSGATLSDATIKGTHTPTQTGVYKVSAWVRAANESGGAVSGLKIFVGDVETDACTGSSAMGGKARLGTYTAMADGVSGTPFEYGFKIKDATINWLAFKNVTITYLGGLPSAEVDALLAQVPSDKMAASIKTELDARVAALEANASVANYNSLASYIATANASVIDYENLATAISNAESYTTYKPVFSASETIYQAGITAAQTVYTNASAENCAATIAALTAAIQNANVSDYNIYTDDYDYSYATLLNEDMTHWTTSDWSLLTSDQHWNGQDNQKYYEQSSAEWGQNSWSHSGTETVTLPAGNYVMGIIARASTTVTSTMTVTVGESTPITTILTHKEDVGKGVTTAGVASFDEGTFANGNNGRGWEYRFVAFTVADDNTAVTINVSASASLVHNWVSLTNPLLKGDVHPNQVILNQISSLVTTLEGYESQIHASTYDKFSTDLTNAAAATIETSTDDLTALVSALQADIATAAAMVTKMTTIANNKGDITSMINGDFTSNTDGWSNGTYHNDLGRSWRGEGTNPFYERGESGTMSYTLNNMPAGTYKVVAASRTYAGGKMKAQVAGGEYGTELTGTGDAAPANGTMEINTNGVEMPYSSLGGFTTVETGHNWHWITATGTLASDGDLVINFTATGNSWMAIDDVHLYCTNLDGTSYTRTVGDGKGTINTSTSVVTADIIMDNPNTILRSTGKVTTAVGDMNNNQYNSSRITKLVLYDSYDFTNSGDNYGLDNGATLYRNIPADTWCTLMVPFYPNNLDEMLVSVSLSEDGVLTFGNAPAKDMNDSPMLVKSSAGVTAITGSRNSTVGVNKGDNTYGAGVPMMGTYSNISDLSELSGKNYVVARKDGADADALYKVNSTVRLKPFRAYFSIDEGAGVKAEVITFNFDDDTTDGISEMSNDKPQMSNKIFNLAGQRVNKAQKGIYIVNGRKVVIK